MKDRRDARLERLLATGASVDAASELLAYAENRFQMPTELPQFPLPDEQFAGIWREYAALSAAAGSIDALRLKMVQLAFPIVPGISEDAAYRAATRRGVVPAASVEGGARFESAEGCRVSVYDSFAGGIGVIAAETRADFETLVRAFMGKNEPIPVPPSMGAAMISGYNNWHRIHLLKKSFFRSGGAEETWAAEFTRIQQRRELYQDRFILLSNGPYSGVDSRSMGLDAGEWLALSKAIRLEHECAHYFTRRVLGSMQNNLLDEMMADYAGIRAAFGTFRAEWVHRFLGIESFPAYREGGRLQNYRGSPPLSEDAFRLLTQLVWRAAWNLEAFDRSAGADGSVPAALLAIASLTIDEIASDGASSDLVEAFAAQQSRREELQIAATQGAI